MRVNAAIGVLSHLRWVAQVYAEVPDALRPDPMSRYVLRSPGSADALLADLLLGRSVPGAEATYGESARAHASRATIIDGINAILGRAD